MSKIEGSAKNSIFFLTDSAEDWAIETVRKVFGEACKEGKLNHGALVVQALKSIAEMQSR